MTNRRVQEAQSLRDFFQLQWDHIEQLFTQWQYQRADYAKQRHTLNQAIDHLVAGTDKRLCSLASYREELRASTRALLEHIEMVVDALPPPYSLDQHTLIHDPTVKHLFHDHHYLRQLFENSWIVKRHCESQPGDVNTLHTVICLYKDEKRVLGSEIHGDMIVRDVMQTMVNFVGHTIVSVHDNETALRSGVKQLLFDNLVAHLRKETVQAQVQTQAAQRAGAVLPQHSIDNPSVYLTLLKRMLAEPVELIRVADQQLTIDSMGIKVPTAQMHTAASAVDALQVHEVSVGDGRSKIISMAVYPLDMQ